MADHRPTFGIITTLLKEHRAMSRLLQNVREEFVPGKGAGRRYLIGEIPSRHGGSHRVALALVSGMGNNKAAVRAVQLIGHIGNVPLILIGIAGGVPNPTTIDEHVRLGDIVVSGEEGVIQYDFVKSTPHEIIQRSRPKPPNAWLLEASEYLESSLDPGDEPPWMPYINDLAQRRRIIRPSNQHDYYQDGKTGQTIRMHPDDPQRRGNQPRVFRGVIASSNALQKNAVTRDMLRDKYDIRAIEMEASGVADAAWITEGSYFVIRGICDYCDEHKGDKWQEYAAIAAAAYTRALLESLPATQERESSVGRPPGEYGLSGVSNIDISHIDGQSEMRAGLINHFGTFFQVILKELVSKKEDSNRQRYLRRIVPIQGDDHSPKNPQLIIDIDVSRSLDIYARDRYINKPSSYRSKSSDIYNIFFEKSGESLLILGGTGSGKTTLLRDLLEKLATLAREDDKQPLPIFLRLEAWSGKESKLFDWVARQLKNEYNIPASVVQFWEESGQLTLLLDGLDQVAHEYREGCIKAINEYIHESSAKYIRRIVVTSRTVDYESIYAKLDIRTAVSMQPLRRDQIFAYLQPLGDCNPLLIPDIDRDNEIIDLLKVPFWLDFMKKSIDEGFISVEQIKQTKIDNSFKNILLASYVREKCKNSDIMGATGDMMLSRLSWLAQRMPEQNEPVLWVEQLQPGWLAKKKMIALRAAFWVTAGLLYSLVTLVLAIATVILIKTFGPVASSEFLSEYLKDPLIGQTLHDLTVRWDASFVERLMISWEFMFFSIQTIILYGLFCSVFISVLGFMATLREIPVETVDRVKWQGHPIIIGLIIWQVITFAGFFALRGDIILALVTSLCSTFVLFMRSMIGISAEERPIPNQGIHSSLKNGLLMWFPGTILSVIMLGLDSAITYGGMSSSTSGFGQSLFIGLFLWFQFGGFAVTQHIAIRIALWASGLLPLNLVAFLNNAHKLGLIDRAGGGYTFFHPLYREYIVSLGPDNNPVQVDIK